MRIPIRATRFPVLFRLIFIGLWFGLLYIFSAAMVNFTKAATQLDAVEQQPSFPIHVQVSDSASEELPISYNLMEETYGKRWTKTPAKYLSSIDCTVEYINKNKLQQDHPCVIQLIRKNYLRQPADKSLPYQLGHPLLLDPSDGQANGILGILRNQTDGFFIECGGYDGETLSNTLYMERSFGWTGLLIEADQLSYKELIKRNRKAYASPVCLSTKPYPMEVVFNATVATLGAVIEKNGKEPMPTTSTTEKIGQDEEDVKNEVQPYVYKVQCFPLYSLLIAVGKPQVDYFSLDIEGSELKVLKTIPWHKVDIRTLTVEWNHVPEGQAAMTHLMEANRFIKFGNIAMGYSSEVVYVKDFLANLRQFEDS